MKLSRRHLLATGAATFLGSAVGAPFVARAQQPQWTYKYANNLPESHPMNSRAREMAAAIKRDTNGRSACRFSPTASSAPTRIR